MLLLYILGGLLFGAALYTIAYTVYKLTVNVIEELISKSRQELYDSGNIDSLSGYLDGVIKSQEGNITIVTITKNKKEVGELKITSESSSSDIHVGKTICNIL